jgi:hypothetical protein
MSNEDQSDISDVEEANFIKKLQKDLENIKESYPSNVSTVEESNTLLINFPILRRRKVMMKELSKIKRRAKPKIKGISTRRRKLSLPKKTIAHLKKVKKKR